jgi:tight adherence protein C
MMNLNNPIIMYVILCIVFIAIFMVLVAINQAIKSGSRRRRIIRTIQNNRDAWTPSAPAVEENALSFSGKIGAIIAKMGARFSNGDTAAYSNQRRRLLRAGIRNANAAQILWGAKIWSPLILVMLFFGMRFHVSQLALLSAPVTAALLIGTGVAGFYLPELWLSVKAVIRREKITKSLPDALDLLVVCVEAGLGLDSAFNKVAEEMKISSPQMSDEFKLLNLELRAGKTRQDALRNLSERVNIDSLKSLVTLLIQTEMFGTGVAKALRVFSDTFRTQRFQAAEEMAAKLPVKMLIPTVFFIFPTFMAIMIGPAAITVWDNWLSK